MWGQQGHPTTPTLQENLEVAPTLQIPLVEPDQFEGPSDIVFNHSHYSQATMPNQQQQQNTIAPPHIQTHWQVPNIQAPNNVQVNPCPAQYRRWARLQNGLNAARNSSIDIHTVAVHDMGDMNIVCPHCHALHWIRERLSSSSARRPIFGICCLSGKISITLHNTPPAELQALLVQWHYT